MGVKRASGPKSFSYLAKDEICTREISHGRAELAAMTLASGTMSATNGDCTICYTTESLPAAKRLVEIIRSEFGLSPAVRLASTRGRSARTVVVAHAADMLDALGVLPDTGTLPAHLISTEQNRISVLRGAFLAGGSVSDPRKNYHLEFVTGTLRFAEVLRDILGGFSIRSNIVPRREHFVLYLNEGDGIAALLALIGAHTSILNMENVRILKETRNNVNRAVNCETANINKTVNAAQTQVNSIRLIDREIGLGQLSAPLREAAELRLDHPEASLQELCELCGTTKSGMNHRLRKINAIARALSGEV